MGLSKTELFEDRENVVADIARVLSHPARVAILQHIIETGKCVNSELVILYQTPPEDISCDC